MPTLRRASHSPRTRLAGGAFILGIALATAGCNVVGAGATPDGRDFLSVDVAGAPKPLVAGTRIRLSFDQASLSASAGCNHIGGTYHIGGGRLVIDGLGTTDMGCDPELHDQDEWLAEFLGSKPAFTLVGNDLTLQSGGTTIRLLDREVAEPDANLVGPTWTVVSILTGDAVSSVPEDAIATLTFAADGTVAVNTGCNQGNGRWVNAGTGVSITEVMLTKRACGGAEAQLESAVHAILGEGIAAQIDADVLTLRGAAGGIQLQAR